MQMLSINLVGSKLYGLDTPTSDYDYTVVYRSELQDYLRLNELNLNRSIVTSTKDNGIEHNFTHWDIKKFLQLCQKNNFAALEILCSKKTSYPLWEVVQNNAKVEHFQLKPLLYHCRGMINRDHQRGYMKAYFYLCAKYMLQNGVIDQFHWQFLMHMTYLSIEEREEIASVLEAKLNGIKTMPFNLELYDSEFENMEVKSHPIDYDALFCEIVMKDYNV